MQTWHLKDLWSQWLAQCKQPQTSIQGSLLMGQLVLVDARGGHDPPQTPCSSFYLPALLLLLSSDCQRCIIWGWAEPAGCCSVQQQQWKGKLKVLVNCRRVSHCTAYYDSAFYHYKIEAMWLTLHLYTMQQVCVCLVVFFCPAFRFLWHIASVAVAMWGTNMKQSLGHTAHSDTSWRKWAF